MPALVCKESVLADGVPELMLVSDGPFDADVTGMLVEFDYAEADIIATQAFAGRLNF